MKEFLENLNDKQRQAVTAPLGPVLVLAGAGSGKTRALTYRIAYLLQQKLFRPEEILALTFTNKAAQEMKGRVEKLLNPMGPARHRKHELGSGVAGGTFHSVCARILRQDIDKLGQGFDRNFTIYDSDDSLTLIKQIVLELGLSENFRPQVFSYYISACKNKLIEPSKLDLDNEFLEQSLRSVWNKYQENLREHNALDFDDLLVRTYELFSTQPKILKKYQERFQYVLVDEYQDTNHVQYRLLKLLVQKHKNIFVVGDDAQSIYGFRGADMRNLLDFKKDYPKARIIMLEQNYRSTQSILAAANKVISLNPHQFEKKLWTEQHAGEKVNLYTATDEEDEAQFIVRQIVDIRAPSASWRTNEQLENEMVYTPIFDSFEQKLKRGFRHRFLSDIVIPDNLQDFVVLYRTHAQSRPIEEILVSAGMPYQIVGGIKFYERREIKDALAFLRLLANPRDLVALERVINLPARGIGRVAFKEITKGLHKYEYNFTRLLNNLDQLELSDKALNGAKEFFEVFDMNIKGGVLDVIDLLLKRSGYKQVLLKEGAEGVERWENIEELYNVAGKFGRLPWADGLPAMLEEVALMTDLDKAEEGGNKLTLMTLHSAKGLEWDHVFLVGLEEGLLPHSRSITRPEEIAEEVRLAYVGMTRARKNLYLSHARSRQSYGELKRTVPSRILKAIPENLLNRLNFTNN